MLLSQLPKVLLTDVECVVHIQTERIKALIGLTTCVITKYGRWVESTAARAQTSTAVVGTWTAPRQQPCIPHCLRSVRGADAKTIGLFEP